MAQYTFQVERATKANIKARVGLMGPPGSGKTLLALIIAKVLAGEDGKIAVIDTENRSSERYADRYDFDIIDLKKPYPPGKYVAAINHCEQADYDVIIVDSITHAWTGTGGALQMVDSASARFKGNKGAAWSEVTPEYEEMVETLTQCSKHLLVTVRSKVKHALAENDRGKTEVIKLGMEPIIREGLEYEFDVVFDIDQEHTAVVTKTRFISLDKGVYRMPGPEVGDLILAEISGGVDRPEPPVQHTKANLLDFGKSMDLTGLEIAEALEDAGVVLPKGGMTTYIGPDMWEKATQILTGKVLDEPVKPE